MSARKRKMLVADLLCGAGGSSTGAARAMQELGLEMDLVCVNHWPVAIDTHQRNHPEARHYVQDIASVRPHIIVPEGYLDLLMASPTCTHHSVARGGKPTSDQQRSDPWHIITWLTELRVKRIIIENVWEFVGWGPVDHRTGKPIKSRKGEYFNAWIDTIRRLGFDPEWRKLNAADYGDATTRLRFILMARSDRTRLVWPAATHFRRKEGAQELRSGLQPWRPAREIINWSIKGKSIFGRKKPLAMKTLARIEAGALKLGWPEPYLVILRRHMAGRCLDSPLPSLATAGHVGLVEPIIMSPRHGRDGAGPRPRGATQPLPTITGGGSQFGIAQPIILSTHNSGAPRSALDPLPTLTTGGAGSDARPGCARPMLAQPILLSRHSEGAARPVDQPVPTMTTAKGGEFALVMPVTHDDGSSRARGSGEPLPTITGANRGELAFIVAQHGERLGQTPRTHDIDQPTPTIAASGHVDLVEPGPHYDILFRMLEPEELGAAMGFTTEDQAYEFSGTKTEKIKQIGNAVSVRKMQACVRAIMADAALAQASSDASALVPPQVEGAACPCFRPTANR
ncbi:hypothetical protein [Microcystis phage Mwe-JY25]